MKTALPHHKKHMPRSWRFPSKGTVCGARRYWRVTKDAEDVTCGRCLRLLKRAQVQP